VEKTKTELLREAAVIVHGFAKGDPGILTEQERMAGRSTLQEQARLWLQEEISEEVGEPSSPQSEELPTDDRWFAAYLKGLEVFGRLHEGSGWSGIAAGADLQPANIFAKSVADDALFAARKQAKENLLPNPE
jgi:hypothetical protein